MAVSFFATQVDASFDNALIRLASTSAVGEGQVVLILSASMTLTLLPSAKLTFRPFIPDPTGPALDSNIVDPSD
jgi:hypothetical protein